MGNFSTGEYARGSFPSGIIHRGVGGRWKAPRPTLGNAMALPLPLIDELIIIYKLLSNLVLGYFEFIEMKHAHLPFPLNFRDLTSLTLLLEK